METADDLAKKYNIKNPITDTYTMTYFNRTIQGNKREVLVTDSLESIWSDFKRGNFEINLLNEKIKMAKSNLGNLEDEFDQLNYFYFALAALGLL